MEEIKLNDDVVDQIKDFNRRKLTKEQERLIDKLVLNEELKGRYKKYGLCKECRQPHTDYNWCQSCNAKHFRHHFKDWTSGNHIIDEFIQKAQLKAKNYKEVLEWIEYDRFENVEYLAKGGFGTTYKAIWKDGFIGSWDSKNNQWERSSENFTVALKCLHNSQDITAEFLREIESHIKMNNSEYVVRCHGITKDLETNNFMIVMYYIMNGSLSQYLSKNFASINWKKKLEILKRIANGLKNIHDKGLIHHDFHSGNILHEGDFTFITDLGLCQPANAIPSQNDEKKIYGVLPYVAPEVLRGKEYTRASDVYGFGMIAYELCTGFPPYHDMAHEEFLAIRICQGLRPKTTNYKIPQLILDIIDQCWDADPLKRPKAEKLFELISNLFKNVFRENSIINKQIKEANGIDGRLSSTTTLSSTDISSYTTTHSQAVYISRLLDFKNLPKPKNAIDHDNSFETEYSESIRIDFIKLNTKQ